MLKFTGVKCRIYTVDNVLNNKFRLIVSDWHAHRQFWGPLLVGDYFMRCWHLWESKFGVEKMPFAAKALRFKRPEMIQIYSPRL